MKSILTICLSICGLQLAAQQIGSQIFSSASGSGLSSNNIQWDWSIGGSLIDSYHDDTDIQFFGGPYFDLSLGEVEEPEDILSVPSGNYDISVFPNPVRDHLKIQLHEKGQSYNIILYDLMGRKALIESYEQTDLITIDFSSVAVGTYHLQLLTSDNRPVGNFKIMKTQ